jgi:hypothetical protein
VPVIHSTRASGGGALTMLAEDESKFLQAASDCLDLARAAKDKHVRITLIVLAQQWLDLAQDRPDDSAFHGVLEAFRDWQMRKKHKAQ